MSVNHVNRKPLRCHPTILSPLPNLHHFIKILISQVSHLLYLLWILIVHFLFFTLNLSFSTLFLSKHESPPQETESPLPLLKKQKQVETPPTTPLTFPSPCREEIQRTINKEQQKEDPSRDEMIQFLKNWAVKVGIEKISLMVKPKEEVEDESQVVKYDMVIAVAEKKKIEEDQQSRCSECSVHEGTLF